ncbi:caspase family protein [Tateyamaria sp. Alg231-49]|uniref:caspase family protein n=1 Tax=Tateyamaria sp. Alg231-49 TaxID=1922219 RepID=UPI000D557FCE|nr:caspase family protein [Tateyamaria sp. Alg231-49]
MRIIILCFTLILTPFVANAEKRLALVIGNDSYAEVNSLQKARADATAVTDALRTKGFTVTTVLDAERREMNKKISEFTGQLEPGDTAMVFYAGHGVEIDGENYLLPTDIAAPASGEKDFIKSESIALSGLLDRIRATGARTTLAIIDACRDNPFKGSTGRSIGGTRGLGRINAPEGTFVIFSAGAGQTALDRLSDEDSAKNSVFTRMLLPRLQTPGIELREMMSGLRRDVRDLARTVGHEQFPAYYDELLGQFFFIPAGGAVIAIAPQPTTAAQPVDPIRADFELARSIDTREAYDAFIERYAARSDEFTVQMAVQLRDELGEATPAGTKPSASANSAQKPAGEASDSREVLRQTQESLNALGCDAGAPDGIMGSRTRAAFRRFLSATDTGLGADDLGTAHGLQALKQHSGRVCKAQPAPSKPAVSATATPDASAKPAPQYSIAGSWSWSASCPLGLKASGTTRYRSGGGNAFTGSISGSAGPATVRGVLNGRSYSATEDYGWVRNTSTGTLSQDGRTLSTLVSNGCRVTARKN